MESVSAWVLQLGHACLWGSVGIAAVGIACRVLPRLPAGVRAWLWWLACAKQLLGLWLAAPINLAVLPAPAPPVPVSAAPAPPPAAHYVPLPSKPTTPASAALLPTAEAPPHVVPQALQWPLLLFAMWLIGIAASLALMARQSLAAAKMQRGTVPVSFANIDLDALAEQMSLRRTPHVLSGPSIPTPCVVNWVCPAILLPPSFSEFTAAELHLTLAHEMAHIKRGDLPLALVPTLARTLFFFHPLVWWASAEWAAAREEACDALALSVTKTPRADYGRLLLKLAVPEAAAPALGLSSGYRHLRRRLASLAHVRQTPRWARFCVLALPLLLPWHLSAALPSAADTSGALPVRYHVTPLAGSRDGSVSGLNNAGRAALSADMQGYVSSGDTLAALDALPKHHASFAYALNNSGQAVGSSFNILGHVRAFFWDGTTHKIGSLPGYPYSEARGISDTGEVAGFAETGHSDRLHAWISRAFVRQADGSLLDLGTLGGPYSAAYAVGPSGSVAGKADTDSGATHAFLWTPGGGMTDLGTLGGANSAAYAVSSAGAVAGVSDTGDSGTRHGFLFADGQLRDLPPLPGMDTSAAYAVSSTGQVVGTSQTAAGIKHATLWQNNRPTDLNTLLLPYSGWTLTEARAVNDHGQIAGQGLWNGKPCAFLLTPADTKRPLPPLAPPVKTL